MLITMTDKVTFDNLPQAVEQLREKIDLLLSQSAQTQSHDDPHKLMTVEELRSFLPEQPARQTVYGWVNDRLIPYEKHGKRLYFRKSAIVRWLDNGRQA